MRLYKRLSSTHLRSIAYVDGFLYVRFGGPGRPVYRYVSVRSIFEALASAPSAGKVFRALTKGFAFEKLRPK